MGGQESSQGYSWPRGWRGLGANRRGRRALARGPGASDQQQLRIGYIEFGSGRVGRVDIDFLYGPTKTGTFTAPSATLVAEKEHFGSSRRVRSFGT